MCFQFTLRAQPFNDLGGLVPEILNLAIDPLSVLLFRGLQPLDTLPDRFSSLLEELGGSIRRSIFEAAFLQCTLKLSE